MINVSVSNPVRNNTIGQPTPIGFHHGDNRSESLNVTRLPLNMYPTDTSLGTGAFKQLHVSTGANTPIGAQHLAARSAITESSYKYSAFTAPKSHGNRQSSQLLPP